MSSTKVMWRVVGTISVASTLLFAAGFGYAAKDILFPSKQGAIAPEEETKPAPYINNNKINIVALGDSLSEGVGDNTARGYVRSVKEKLEKATGKPTFVLNNFAISGYRTAQLLDRLNAQKQVTEAIGEADLVLLTIGGNDIFEGGKGIFDNASQGFNVQAAVERMPDALNRLEQIFQKISPAAKNAKIMYVGLYHPFADLDLKREGGPVIEQWNNAVFKMANKYPNIIVVPTYDLFALNGRTYLSDDHFHPNREGYDRIAERIVQVLE